MEFNSRLSQILTDLALQLPSLLGIVVCMVVVLMRRNRHPKVSALALIGLALVLIHGPVFVFIYAWSSDLFLHNASADEIRSVWLVLGLIFNLTRAIAFAPLLAAIFVQRPRPGEA